MKRDNINNFIKGWFVGNFKPTLIKTNDVEVAFKRYKKGDQEETHYHKIASEISLIIEGIVKVNGEIFKKNEIFIMEPNEVAHFEVLENCATVVVKYPGANDDKYILEE